MVAASALAFALVGWTRRGCARGATRWCCQASSPRAYSAGLAMIMVFFGGMIGTILVLTLFLQLGEHFSAIHAGLTLAPFAFGTAVGAVLVGAVLVPRLGRRALQAAGW